MRIFRYIMSTGDADRLDVDEEMAKCVEELCRTQGPLNDYRYFAMHYNAMGCCYEFACNRELANKVMEIYHDWDKTNNGRNNMTLKGWTDSFSAKIQEATDDLYDKIFGKEEPKMPIKYNHSAYRIPVPVKIINHGPATIVFWDDKTKTVVKCSDNDEFDPDMAITMACLKKMVGDEAYAKAKQMGHKKKIQNMIEWKD